MRMGEWFLNSYAFLMGRASMQRWNRLLISLGRRGLGVLNYSDFKVSGEEGFISVLLSKHHGRLDPFVIFDVGANSGQYASMVLRKVSRRKKLAVYSFEPSKKAFKSLSQSLGCDERCLPKNLALSSRDGSSQLYDAADGGGSQAATLEIQYSTLSEESQNYFREDVAIRRGDSVVQELGVSYIDLLKLDVEGHELEVIDGFQDSLAQGLIGAIQFEFNSGMRHKGLGIEDFRVRLPRYTLFRLLPSGRLLSLENEEEDIYLYQNIVALPNS